MKTLITTGLLAIAPVLAQAQTNPICETASHYCYCDGPIEYGDNRVPSYWLKRVDVYRGKPLYQHLKRYLSEQACEAGIGSQGACRANAQ